MGFGDVGELRASNGCLRIQAALNVWREAAAMGVKLVPVEGVEPPPTENPSVALTVKLDRRGRQCRQCK